MPDTKPLSSTPTQAARYNAAITMKNGPPKKAATQDSGVMIIRCVYMAALCHRSGVGSHE